MPSGPDLEIILTDDPIRGSCGSLSDGDDMFLTIDTLNNDFPVVERPRALQKKESMQQEKQVSVDPMSLMGSSIRQASFKLVSTPPRAPRSPGMSHPSPLPPPKLKFVTSSLPSSASSSPRSYTSMPKKQWEGSPGCPQPHQNWAMDDNDLALQEYNMRKSRSEGEGRASVSADDFNIMPAMGGGTKYDDFNSFSKPVNAFGDTQSRSSGKHGDLPEDGFKCGKLCLFLPRGKGKTVRASSSKSISSMTSRTSSMPSQLSQMSNRMPPIPSHKAESVSSTRSQKRDLPVISRRVSLERFDPASLSPSVMSDDEGEEPTSLFFDLPLEMIRYSVSEVQSPITAAFLFEKEAKTANEPKGVIRNASPSTDARRSMSQDSSRHVRFSTSSATSSPSVSSRQNWGDDLST